MEFSEKLYTLRKTKGCTQEQMAERLGVSRQALAKWEAGQSLPDIEKLLRISDLLRVTVDYLIRDQECSLPLAANEPEDIAELIRFRLKANVSTYAGYMNQTASTRLDSHDYRYEEGPYVYHDTYLGGEQFAGEEAVWKNGRAVYAMNYMGRVLGEQFSGDFLKEALRAATPDRPFRGPAHYQAGEYLYKSSVTGDIRWFQGTEEIWCRDERVYECCFHGGLIR